MTDSSRCNVKDTKRSKVIVVKRRRSNESCLGGDALQLAGSAQVKWDGCFSLAGGFDEVAWQSGRGKMRLQVRAANS